MAATSEAAGTGGRFNVIIAVDHSKSSVQAFDWYVECLHRPGNHVILVHAPEHPTTHSTKGMRLNDGDIQKMLKQEKDETDEMLQKYSQKLKEAQIQGDYKTFYSHKAGEAIVEAAKELQANTIVMGTRGMGKLRRTIMGSVSDYVVHHSHVPVVVCRH